VPTALVRAVSPALAACDLTHLDRSEIDVRLASTQHQQYVESLASRGVRIVELPPLPDVPDAVFVEDQAVVVEEAAVIGAVRSTVRRMEAESVAAELAKHRPLHYLNEPAMLEGGDVLRIGRRIFVGQSSRTNDDGSRQLATILEPFGYSVRTVEVRGCLHLKTGCCWLGADLLLANPDWIDLGSFPDLRVVAVDGGEPFAANVLRIGDRVLMPAGYPQTYEKLLSEGLDVRTLDISELQKAEAGLTCMSILFSG
jgi:dimethylargininase